MDHTIPLVGHCDFCNSSLRLYYNTFLCGWKVMCIDQDYCGMEYDNVYYNPEDVEKDGYFIFRLREKVKNDSQLSLF